MSIEIGKQYISKDEEVVEVIHYQYGVKYWVFGNEEREVNLIWYQDNWKDKHVLTERDFLEQYKPCEEYVYRWVYIINNAIGFSAEKMTEEEFKKHYLGGNINLYACIFETKEKRERKVESK